MYQHQRELADMVVFRFLLRARVGGVLVQCCSCASSSAAGVFHCFVASLPLLLARGARVERAPRIPTRPSRSHTHTLRSPHSRGRPLGGGGGDGGARWRVRRPSPIDSWSREYSLSASSRASIWRRSTISKVRAYMIVVVTGDVTTRVLTLVAVQRSLPPSPMQPKCSTSFPRSTSLAAACATSRSYAVQCPPLSLSPTPSIRDLPI